MPRLPTVRLRRRRDGLEVVVNAHDYAADLARWRGWRRIGESGGEAAATMARQTFAAMAWPELRAAARAATGRAPRSRRAALRALEDKGRI